MLVQPLVKYFSWDTSKNEGLKADRGISFEEIVLCIHEGRLVTILEHPNKAKYLNQRLYLVERGDYVYVVPFVEDESAGEIILKTIYPGRQYTRRYLGRRRDHGTP